MNALNLLDRLRQSRKISLTLFALSLLALVLTAVWFLSARSAMSKAYVNLGNAKQTLAEAQVREQEAQLKVENARSANELMQTAQSLGFQPGDWGERLVNLRQVQMQREDALAMLGSVNRSEQLVFGPEAFELSVTHPDEGLFDVPVLAGHMPAPLNITLRGSVMFRTAEASTATVVPQGGRP